MKVLAVKDSKVGIFLRPVFAVHLAEAMRSFEDAVRQGDSVFSRHPNDYALYHLGEFDDTQGKFTMLDNPVEMMTARFVVDTTRPSQLPLAAAN